MNELLTYALDKFDKTAGSDSKENTVPFRSIRHCLGWLSSPPQWNKIAMLKSSWLRQPPTGIKLTQEKLTKRPSFSMESLLKSEKPSEREVLGGRSFC